jgi:hypothetical protein
MSRNSGFASIETLESWFKGNNLPYFTVYWGRSKEGKNVLRRSIDEKTTEEAWEDLENLLESAGGNGGVFTILQSEKPRSNYGFTAILNLPQAPAAAVNGIHAPIGYNTINEAINERIENEREKWELAKAVQDLQGAIENQGSFLERISERILNNPKIDQIVEVLALRFLGGGQPKPAAVHVSGFEGQQATAQPEDQSTEFTYDTDRILPALEVIRATIGDPHSFMEVLARICVDNPELVKSIYKQYQNADN